MGEAIIQTTALGRDFVQRRRLFQRQQVEATTALDGVSFALQPGRCLALEGPNGAGKSTLLRILATLIAPTRGRAVVAGYDVSRQPAGVRARIGYAGNAERSFFWPLTGLENLIFFGELAGLSHSESVIASQQVLERVGLSEAAANRVSGYSSGMRQRLGLARALVHDPSVLLLDEPTANLDAQYRGVAIKIINDAVSRGRAVVVATHDPGLVSETATDMLRLEGGRTVQSPPPSASVRYRLHLAPAPPAAGTPEQIDVEDLGDGHILAEALSSAVADGREVVSVEQITS